MSKILCAGAVAHGGELRRDAELGVVLRLDLALRTLGCREARGHAGHVRRTRTSSFGCIACSWAIRSPPGLACWAKEHASDSLAPCARTAARPVCAGGAAVVPISIGTRHAATKLGSSLGSSSPETA
eukprot:scaffold119260_cov45-Phaeocystis_antarctica.AAC.5